MSETGGWTRAYKAMALVTALPISTVLGGLLGAQLDKFFGSGVVCTVMLGLLGFSAGIYQLFRGLRRLSDDDSRDHPP